ncbi:MAG: uracil-DNA glycosylase family protein [Candidatus Woesearchaeota archaeon]
MRDSLKRLWNEVEELHTSEFLGHKLKPIFGNGKTAKPKFMFVFINPTARNISSHQGWEGPRFPFIGTKQIWRVFLKAGLFDAKLMQEIEESDYWSTKLTRHVLGFLRQKSFYFTNLVKWTGHDARLPDSKKIKMFLPILLRELKIVKPRYVVTFGLLPFESLMQMRLQLGAYYEKLNAAGRPVVYNAHGTKIIPCYFPVGRGNPKRAVEILKLLAELP